MNIRPIKSEKDYKEALKRFKEIFDAEEGTLEGDEAEILAILIEKYEDVNHPVATPNPVEAIKFRMEQLNIERKDLAAILGSKSRVSEILSGKRNLTLNMIRKLHHHLNLPYESLMGDHKSGNKTENV